MVFQLIQGVLMSVRMTRTQNESSPVVGAMTRP
jgi:hypothetical protein